jgi:hypothetical protein
VSVGVDAEWAADDVEAAELVETVFASVPLDGACEGVAVGGRGDREVCGDVVVCGLWSRRWLPATGGGC